MACLNYLDEVIPAVATINTKRTICINFCVVFGIVYLVIYRILQQREWSGASLKPLGLQNAGGSTPYPQTPLPYQLQISGALPYVYIPPEAAGLRDRGRPFSVDPSFVEKLHLPPTRFFNLTNDTVRDFVFVTAVDTSHFAEVKDCIASVQRYFPTYDILLYDLGMTGAEISQVKHWCNVIYRKFETSGYPKHVRRITHKAFKFVVIQHVLAEYGAAFWVDASFRATDPIDAWQDVFDLALSNGGIVMAYNETGEKPLTNYAWSDPYMFQFLPTDLEKQKELIQQCSCATLVYNTEFVFRNVLWWMYLCSLERECISRTSGTAKIDWQSLEPEQLKRTFIVHRYDQSALNTILGNLFGYDQSKYTTVENHNVIRRMPTNMFEIQTCA